MRPLAAPTIRLVDYAPPTYTIDHVDLAFMFDPERTQVRATLSVRRAEGTDIGTPLVLDGDELTLVSVAVDGSLLDESAYETSPETLTIVTPPEAETFTITIETEIAPRTNRNSPSLHPSVLFCNQLQKQTIEFRSI